MQIVNTLSIDLRSQGFSQRIRVMQADANTRSVELHLYDGGAVWPVPSGVTAALGYKKPDGTSGLYDKLPDGTAAITVADNVITVILAPQALTVPGTVAAAVVLNDAALNQLSTFPFDICVTANPAAGASISENYYYFTSMTEINDSVNAALSKLNSTVADVETKLSNGDFVGAQGPQGPAGPQGEQGPKGEDGTGVTILGSYDTVEALKAAQQTGSAGDSYLVNGYLYVWSANANDWENVGNIQGPQGPRGPAGPQGEKGEKGDTGATGPKGPQGEKGVDGAKGDKGDTGPQGEKGDTGSIGPQGPKGETGPQGPQGEKGADGTGVTILGSFDSESALNSAHPTGTVGESYLVNGYLYVWSETSSSWENVGNIQGPKGEKGDTGATGAQGPQGEKGAEGAKGDKGDTGPQGPQGEQGPAGKDGAKGDTGPQGPQGEKGADGAKGDIGPQGPQGETGADGKDGVSVTHSWSGTTLRVTSASGTSSADLKGEKGDKGDKGDTGLQGPKGETGAEGAQGPKGDPGETGSAGYSPVRGKDYWTASDIAEIKSYVDDAILGGAW